MRIHDDYHLGKVLRSEEDFIITDFDGDPSRTLQARRMKQSPLKDVASMLRSFNYAAAAALTAFAPAGAMAERLSPWADTWQHWVSRAFLGAYRDAMEGSSVVPSASAFDPLLRALVIDKALEELARELNDRPEWAHIPLRALVTLALPLQSWPS